VLVAGLLLVGLLLVGLAHGAIAASFAESGSNFKISASQLRGRGFLQFASIDQAADGAHPVARGAISEATIDNFCQSALVPSLPIIGEVSLVVHAPGRDSAHASNLIVNTSELAGTVSFRNVTIGVDASQLNPSQLSPSPPGVAGPPDAFAQQADQIVIDNLRQTARQLTASTLTLTGLQLTVTRGRTECF
jgi:Family of unknown function (DUF6230)